MSTVHLHTLTNGTFVPWNSSQDSFVPDITIPSPFTSDPHPCPTCPRGITHRFTVRSGNDQSQGWAPAKLITATTSVGSTGDNLTEVPLVLADGSVTDSNFIMLINDQLQVFSPTGMSLAGRACSAQRLATGLRDALVGFGGQASIVDGPTRIEFTDQSGASWTFLPKANETKSATLSDQPNQPTIISLSGTLLPLHTATGLESIPLAGMLTLVDQDTRNGRFSTLMTFHVSGMGNEAVLMIPPGPTPTGPALPSA